MRPFQVKSSAAIASAALSMIGMVAGCGQDDSFAPPPPPKVTVQVPIRRDVTSYVEYTGTTKALETVDLRARVKGFLKERLFDEKTPVKKDQPLFVIDEETFKVAFDMSRARLDEAEANLKKAEQSKAKEVSAAQLALDQASLVLAKVEERRSKNLVDRNAGTREALDQSEATRRKAEAQVQADHASLDQAEADYQTNILSAKANVEAARSDVRNAEINLGYCRINAPFDGWVSRRLFDVGNLVGDGSASVLATIYKDNPIYAYVNVSESDLLMFRQMAREGTQKSYEKGELIPLDLGLGNEDGFPHAGMLDYSDPSVDPQSGTVLVRGIFDNPNRVIVPGLFVRIRVARGSKAAALLVPEEARQTDQRGDFLMVVDEKNLAQRRDVRLGAQEGPLRVIEGNLKPDDLVIVRGLQRARPELPVVPERVEPSKPALSAASNAPNP